MVMLQLKILELKELVSIVSQLKEKNGDIDAPSFKTESFIDLKPGKYN